MFTPHVVTTWSFPDTPVVYYGYGWFITTLVGHTVAYHTGGNAGYVSVNMWLPNDDITIVVLANEDAHLDPRTMGMHIAGAIVMQDGRT